MPAAAGVSVHAASNLYNSWEAAGSGTFDSIASLTATGFAAHGTGGNAIKKPSLNAAYTALPGSANGKGGSNWKTVNVPVWFHVVHDGAIGNVTDQDVATQIQVMNLGYSGFYGGYDQKFRFKLVGITRTDNADWFYGGINGAAERPMKRAVHKGGFETLNIYSTTAGPYLGWADLPGLSASLTISTGSSSTGHRCTRPRPRTRPHTTSGSQPFTRSVTGSGSSTRSSAAATPPATT